MRHCEPVTDVTGVATPRIFKPPKSSNPCPLLLGEGAAAAAGVEGTPYQLGLSRMNVQPAGTEHVFLLLEEGGTAFGRAGWWRGPGTIRGGFV